MARVCSTAAIPQIQHDDTRCLSSSALAVIKSKLYTLSRDSQSLNTACTSAYMKANYATVGQLAFGTESWNIDACYSDLSCYALCLE